MLDLQQEMRDRFASNPRTSGRGGGFVPTGEAELNGARDFGDGVSSGAFAAPADCPSEGLPGITGSKASALFDEAQLANQKLRRELAEVNATNAKLVLANSQLEDDIAHLQRRYDDEKRAHLNEKKLHIPKVQKVGIAAGGGVYRSVFVCTLSNGLAWQLEEAIQTTARAFDELKLSVDLITNMYKVGIC